MSVSNAKGKGDILSSIHFSTTVVHATNTLRECTVAVEHLDPSNIN